MRGVGIHRYQFSVGATEKTAAYAPAIFSVFFPPDWIPVSACVAEQACSGGRDIRHGSRARRWEERRRVWWLVWLGVRVLREGEGCGSRWE